MPGAWLPSAAPIEPRNRFPGGGLGPLVDRLLVDTSIWIDHFRRHEVQLAALLDDGLVVTHPFVIGELACGNLAQRNEVLELISALPSAPVADDEEVLAFVESRRLMGRGLGWIDVHLLASAVLASLPLWTSDKKLSAVAREFRLQP